MKKIIAYMLTLCTIISLVGCGKQEATIKETIDGKYYTYYEMSDGTWKCGDLSYKYRLEISGRMPNTSVDATFVYLSNLKEISFEQAWKAAGLSSFSGDYFPLEDAILVELRAD